MCNRIQPDHAPAIAAFLGQTRFCDEGAKTIALMQRFPSVTYSEVIGGELLALELVKARIATGEEPREGGGRNSSRFG